MFYNGPSNLNDISDVMTIDNSGNIYVCGRSRQAGSPGYFDFVTIKYSQTITVLQPGNIQAEKYKLKQNYPNPFNPSTNLEFETPDLAFVSLKVFDVLGNEIVTLVNKKMDAGKYLIQFNGSSLPSGVYFYGLEIESEKVTYSDVKRMILLK